MKDSALYATVTPVCPENRRDTELAQLLEKTLNIVIGLRVDYQKTLNIVIGLRVDYQAQLLIDPSVSWADFIKERGYSFFEPLDAALAEHLDPYLINPRALGSTWEARYAKRFEIGKALYDGLVRLC